MTATEHSATEPTLGSSLKTHASRASLRACVNCGEEMRASRRRHLMDFPVRLLGFKPYRCHRCGARVYRFR